MDLAHEFINETRVFGDLIAAGNPSAPVRTCPGWNLTQLLKHVGRGNRWAAEIVLQRHQEAIDPSTVPEGKPPGDMDGAIEWLHAGALHLNDAVAEEHDAVVWTFTGPQPASWWVRRRLHETVVHRADAAIASVKRSSSTRWSAPTRSANGWISPRIAVGCRGTRSTCTPSTAI